ncbi:hypothetical protein J4E81_010757 [Alternaria sp. BMP 2799]|nr:hypothetical protein J4E81_010757 [Alternaria sp. BMP 2799]
MDREAITAANQLRSPLLRLPGEIRNRIYGYAFCGEDNTENALLKTCKQIEHESKPIYYSHLTLSFTHFDDIRHVIARVRPELLAMVKSVRTGAVTAKTMAVSILQDASEDASDKLDWSECSMRDQVEVVHPDRGAAWSLQKIKGSPHKGAFSRVQKVIWPYEQAEDYTDESRIKMVKETFGKDAVLVWE